MDYPYQIPRYVHRDGAAQLVSTEAACDAALADGWEIHPSLVVPIVVDVDEVAPIEEDEAAAPDAGVVEDAPKKKRKR